MRLEISAAITGQNTGKPQAPDIWQAQFMLWIQQDVCQALAAANKNASCVLDAPVKHLVKLVVRPTFVTGAAPGGAMGAPRLAKVAELPQHRPECSAANGAGGVGDGKGEQCACLTWRSSGCR